MRAHDRKARLEPPPDPLGGAPEHRRPVGERRTGGPQREQARRAVAGHQPQPLRRGQRPPRAAHPVEVGALPVRVAHPQRLAQPGWGPPLASAGRGRALQADVVPDLDQRVVVEPGRARLAALGRAPAQRERHRDRRTPGRQRRHLVDQQVGQLLPAQPAGQRQPAHRGVAAQLPTPIRVVRAAVGCQPGQGVEEHRGEVVLEVLDLGVPFRRAQLGVVAPHRPHRAAGDPLAGRVAERPRAGVALGLRPLVEQRQRGHVQVPR